jgi:hypothetical protein
VPPIVERQVGPHVWRLAFVQALLKEALRVLGTSGAGTLPTDVPGPPRRYAM